AEFRIFVVSGTRPSVRLSLSGASGPLPSDERGQQRLELQLRFLQLARRVGVGHHSDARTAPGAVLPPAAAAQRDRELAVASSVDPPDRTRIPTPPHAFELG